MARGRAFIGTSGWSYDHWVGPFYPAGTRAGDRLGVYARSFRTVEINSTFYGLPTAATVAAWRDSTPPGFHFACKASRFITHMKKLKDPAAATARFFGAMSGLGDRLGPVLFQLPPRWRIDAGRLTAFLDALPAGKRYAFEFRDESWFDPSIYRLLEARNTAFCAYDLGGRRSPVRRTADFAYIRLHGPAGPYRGRYDGRTLAGWARRIRSWRAEGLDVHCYFDNDEAGYAPADALRLISMVEGST
jgi:uncharacterized protein YecE (DUF72 family)